MIPLEPGDLVVSAISVQDFVLVFTQRGHVYRVTYRQYMSIGPQVTVEKL